MHELLTKGIGHTEFKDTEIGKIPKEWGVVKVENIVMPEDGIKRGPWGSMIKKEFFVESGYKVYEQKNVILNDFTVGDYYINDEKFDELKNYEIKPGDILMTSAGTIGKIAIVPEGIQRGIFNQALIRIRLNGNKINILFFKYLFESGLLERQLRKFTYGATQVNLASIKILKQILLPLPPLPEQQKNRRNSFNCG
ncbi:Type I restriction modification DNA specificity domain [Geoglobus ahangari]|uniref:Type I restriction modification DNA specificity domain n=1 Tax=Geoglobus ahangari TaxID=113653 RepID=A0A0F7IFR6_9EURY|nr:restriction endonuclease subunit S [Geoglobus ahangari]AKG91330.1 Type I restriction modification DNA specificity domain [Geoglobus ahangari]